MNRDNLIDLLNKTYPKLNARISEEFDGRPNGIWVSGESGHTASDEHPLFSYYNEDYKEVRYVFGIHKEVRDLIEPQGWYCEWYDAGTIIISEE